jgi:hypothetical protein
MLETQSHALDRMSAIASWRRVCNSGSDVPSVDVSAVQNPAAELVAVTNGLVTSADESVATATPAPSSEAAAATAAAVAAAAAAAVVRSKSDFPRNPKSLVAANRIVPSSAQAASVAISTRSFQRIESATG